MPLHAIDNNLLREHCKKRVEAFEIWIKRLIDEELTAAYGADYINYESGGHFIINKKIRGNIEILTKSNPERFTRSIDAAFFDDMIDVLCNTALYDKFFKQYFNAMFPHSMPQQQIYLRHCLDRLKDIRNNLAHTNPISLKDIEFTLSFTTDCIDSFKSLYNMKGKAKEYDVPQIIKVTDSFGNVLIRKNFSVYETLDLTGKSDSVLRPGDTISIEVEIDPSYTAAKYQIRFGGTSQEFSYKTKLVYTIQNHDVSARKPIYCQVKSDKPWNKEYMLDDQVTIYYKVLPPIE